MSNNCNTSKDNNTNGSNTNVTIILAQERKSFLFADLNQIWFFEKYFAERWEKQKNTTINLFDSSLSLFSLEDLQLLIETCKHGKIPENKDLTVEQMNGFLKCYDYCCDKDNGKAVLEEYVLHCTHCFHRGKRDKYIESTQNEVIIEILQSMNKKEKKCFRKNLEKCTNDYQNPKYIHQVLFDPETASQLLFHHLKYNVNNHTLLPPDHRIFCKCPFSDWKYSTFKHLFDQCSEYWNNDDATSFWKQVDVIRNDITNNKFYQVKEIISMTNEQRC